MKYVLIWILLLPAIDEKARVLTSGSAEFETKGACLDAASWIGSIDKVWKEDRPLLLAECLPSKPDSETYGACFDRYDDREQLLACIQKHNS